ncbi:type III secretion system chaperone [Parachitinimonas caeni]|uniref:Type III secretion system chaperone n=1 Tax=Parachitinimonas caeni TaxID=3031301 RepID=A0ABT7E1D5_9NEIS|nr:type III secretion system chaperone [Parachitinimonas caeni]MDK2124722.1 type III secretion system chaperone [Parachitinimonas caeni]
MSFPSVFTEVMGHFAKAFGLEALTPEADGACQVVIDDSVVINFGWNPANENLVLFSPVGTLADGSRAEVMAAMLKANLFWKETGGATLALDSSGSVAVLNYQHPVARLDESTTRELAQWFFDTTNDWTSRLRDIQSGAGASAAPHAELNQYGRTLGMDFAMQFRA